MYASVQNLNSLVLENDNGHYSPGMNRMVIGRLFTILQCRLLTIINSNLSKGTPKGSMGQHFKN